MGPGFWLAGSSGNLAVNPQQPFYTPATCSYTLEGPAFFGREIPDVLPEPGAEPEREGARRRQIESGVGDRPGLGACGKWTAGRAPLQSQARFTPQAVA